MPSNDLERARTQFLDRLTHEGVGLLMQQPLVSYWNAVAAEAQQTDDLSRLQGWKSALTSDKDKIAALKNRAETITGMDSETILLLILDVLDMLGDAERAIDKRLLAVRDRIGRWVFLAGPGVKKKAPKDEDESDEETKSPSAKRNTAKRALIQRAQDKKEPKKVKSI